MLLACLLAATSACGGGSTPTGPTPPQDLGHGTISALIDGVNYPGRVVLAAVDSGRLLIWTVSSADPAFQIHLNLSSSTSGAFGSQNSAMIITGAVTAAGVTPTGVWGTGASSGSYVLSSQTSTEARGTFSFVAEPAPGTTPAVSRVVTNGTFNVRF